MDRAQTVPAMRKKKGAVQTAHETGFLRMWTTALIRPKVMAPNPAAHTGAIPRPAKMAPRPLPPFHPHCCERKHEMIVVSVLSLDVSKEDSSNSPHR